MSVIPKFPNRPKKWIERLLDKISQLSNPNLLINSDMQINQRGQAIYTGTGYTVDRWNTIEGSSTEIVDTEYGKGLYVVANSNNRALLMQPFEDIVLQNLKGKTVTLSFYAKADKDNAYTDIYIGHHGFNINIGTELKRYVFTVNYAAESTLLHCKGVAFFCESNITIVCPKLEVGSIATPFVAPDPATELMKCQRCYEISSGRGELIYRDSNYDGKLSIITQYKTTKRVIPTLRLLTDVIDIWVFSQSKFIENLQVKNIEYGCDIHGVLYFTIFYSYEQTDPLSGMIGIIGITSNTEPIFESDAEIH